MIVLGVDFGEKRVGLAISDMLGMIAQPLETLSVKSVDDAIAQVAEVATQKNAELIVVGMPINMNASVGKKAQEAAAFAEALGNAVEIDVKTWDERLSSVAADRAMRSAGMSCKKRKGHRDKIAATIILQGYLDAQ